MTFQTDIIIIGAGPVGLFASFQAGMHGLSTTIMDVLDEAGGQCIALYPDKPIYDIPAFPTIQSADLVARLIEQASPFNPNYILGSRVEQLVADGDEWIATNSKGISARAKVIIIAAGVGAFVHNRPPLDNIEAFENRSILYKIGSLEKFRNKAVMIAGGGDSAIDWAIALSKISSITYLVHRREQFRAFPESVKQLHELIENGRVKLLTPYQLSSVNGNNSVLSSVEIKHLDGESKEIPVDYLIPCFGLKMELGPIANWGIELSKGKVIVDHSDMATDQPGIFAIGDIASYPGKMKLILTGFAEAALACHSAYNIINPDKPLHFEYSTTKGVPRI
jgi:thioredoxin reductase (NADPH)